MSCRCSSSAPFRWGCSTSWLKEYALQRQSFGSAFCFEDDRTDTQTHAHRIMRYRARLCEPEPRPHKLANIPTSLADLRLSLAAAPQKGALRAALLPPVGFCATAQGSASPNPARTSSPICLLYGRAYGLSLATAPQKGALRAALLPPVGSCAPRKALRARTPPARNHLKIQIFLRACGLSLAAAPKKGAHFDMCSLFWCRWSDSNRHGIATTGF